jgi:hypothetical protein
MKTGTRSLLVVPLLPQTSPAEHLDKLTSSWHAMKESSPTEPEK